jgi:hypothetical protein
MTGSELYTLGTELNGGAAIRETLFFQILNAANPSVSRSRHTRLAP